MAEIDSIAIGGLRDEMMGSAGLEVPAAAAAPLATASPAAAAHEAEPVSLTYYARSTVLIGLDGVRLLTDPSLPSASFLGRSRRVPPEPLPEVDVVLVTHGHARHMDPATLRRLPGHPRILAPAPQAEALRRAGFPDAEAVEAGDTIGIGGVAIQTIVSEHRALHAALPPRHHQVGFLIQGSSTIYFAGDSVPTGVEVAVEGVDIALLPVAPVLQYVGHLSPSDAAETARLTRPRVVIPVHWAAADRDELLPPWMPRRETFTPERLEAALRRAFAAAGVTAELRFLGAGYSTAVSPLPGSRRTASAPARGVVRRRAAFEKGTAGSV